MLLKTLIRLALCSAVAWVVYRYLGLLGAVSTIPLFAAALVSPVMALVAGFHRGTKAMVLADVQGRYFEHHGHAMDVLEDEEGHPWLAVRDARKVLPGLPRDEVLQRLHPGRTGTIAPSRELRIRADALVAQLHNAQEPAGVKFKVWLEREVLRGRR